MTNTKKFRDLVNFRDLGGYETEDGRKVKKGLFYRSAGLYFFNEEEKKMFMDLGIRSILDLRTKEEADSNPDPLFEGVQMLRHSGVVSKGGEEIDFSPTGMGQIGQAGKAQYENLMHYYALMPFENEALHVLMHEIEENELPIVFHCATGKDRTGVAAMVILLLLGVDRKTILEDYDVSNWYRRDDKAKIFTDNAEQLKDEYGERLLTMRGGVLHETGEAVLDSIIEKYGTYENYFLNEFGYDAERIQKFRELYTEA